MHDVEPQARSGRCSAFHLESMRSSRDLERARDRPRPTATRGEAGAPSNKRPSTAALCVCFSSPRAILTPMSLRGLHL